MKKAPAIIIILAAVAAGLFYFYKQSQPEMVQNPASPEKQAEAPITITSEEIREENFTGSKPVIEGDSRLALAARSYVENEIGEFEARANEDVPAMKEEFGADSPSASYTIEISASQTEGEKTRSVVITEYVYSGGAHGSSLYKIFTASKESGEILSLSDIIKIDKQGAFVALVKEKLNAWRPAGSESAVVFPEDVAGLSFEAFSNWAIDGDKFVLYFSQYEVGPGVLGAFELPIPLAELAGLLL